MTAAMASSIRSIDLVLSESTLAVSAEKHLHQLVKGAHPGANSGVCPAPLLSVTSQSCRVTVPWPRVTKACDATTHPPLASEEQGNGMGGVEAWFRRIACNVP